ncbi:hypothetical protein D049_4611B, partial [Vibrio parahaemolyticus VPTS-2010]
KVPIDPAPLYC